MSDDEEHFRNVLVCAGEITDATRELFYNPVHRSFADRKSGRHLRQLLEMMKEIETPSGLSHMIFPGQCERVCRVLRKILRGLAFYHFGTPVPEEDVTILDSRIPVPPGLLPPDDNWNAFVPDVFQYFGHIFKTPEGWMSAWGMKFFMSRIFLGVVRMSEEMEFDRETCTDLTKELA